MAGFSRHPWRMLLVGIMCLGLVAPSAATAADPPTGVEPGTAVRAMTAGAPRASAGSSAAEPPVATGWGPVRAVRSGVFAGPQALARTVSGPTTYLHAAWLGAYPYYRRSSDGGATWTKLARLSDSPYVSDKPVIAGAGSNVYVAWVRRFASTGTAVYFRRNTTHGNLSAWRAKVRLTGRTADLEGLSIAAAGAAVYLGYADLGARRVRLLVSRDRGATWIPKTMGTGIYLTEDEGEPRGHVAVAASGTNVAVAWWGPGGVTRVRVSTDLGAHWSPAVDVGSGAPSITALGARVAVSGIPWAEGERGWVRSWAAGTWGPVRPLPELPLPPGTTGRALEPAVALRGSSAVGVAYSLIVAAPWSARLQWAESADGGVTWGPPELVSPDPSTVSPDYEARLPAVVWRSTGQLSVLWNVAIPVGLSIRTRN